jgi:NAD(P)-dependent dehydrogenase (short-subunit alcohol dehydrogenase family)
VQKIGEIMLLDGKIALVTGAAQGIGKGIATALAGERAVVVLTDIQEQKVTEAAAEIHKSTGAATKSCRLDVTDASGIGAVVASVEKEFGRIDILVNNAGVQEWVPFLETSEEMWDRHQAVNVKGTFLLSQAVARIMVRQGGGKIINIASDSGVAPTPEGAAAYCTSKSAVIGLTRVIAKELGRHGVYCNAICPGAINTPMMERFLKTTQQKVNSVQAWAEVAALKRIGQPEDIGRVALFLASHLSDFITGEHLLVTGGDIMSQ